MEYSNRATCAVAVSKGFCRRERFVVNLIFVWDVWNVRASLSLARRTGPLQSVTCTTTLDSAVLDEVEDHQHDDVHLRSKIWVCAGSR